MKAIIGRRLNQLSPSEQKRIEVMYDEAYNRDMMIILDIYLKMSCEVLHDAFGFGEERLTRYLGNYRRHFRRHAKLVRRGEQLPVLDERMRKIFRKSGYPDEFFKTIFSTWEAKTKEDIQK